MQIRSLERGEAYEAIKDSWNRLVLKQSSGIFQFDVTATYEWAMTLWETHLDLKNEQILVLEESGQVKGVIPLFRREKRLRSILSRQISPLYEIYAQRCGFILDDPSEETFSLVMNYLLQEIPGWDVFEFTLVDGSTSDHRFKQFVEREKVRYELIGTEKSPYMELSASWASFSERLSSKFRSNLRSYEKKLRAVGDLKYKACHRLDEVEEFLGAMLEIERDSWKEIAGTSITVNPLQEAFYNRFIRVASERGWFSGHLLWLGEEPVAYIYGLTFNGCFSSMKTSYKAKYQKMGAGHLIRMFALQQLHIDGVKIHDFTGLCEDHKLAWADSTYSRSSYRIYNKSLRALGAQVYGKMAAIWKPVENPALTAEDGESDVPK